MSSPRVHSVRLAMAIATAVSLVACGAQDSQGPEPTPGVVTLLSGQSAAIEGATTLRIVGGSQGTENLIVITDTATTGVSAKATYSVTATNVSAPGSVSAPATTRLPDATRAATALAAGPELDMSFGMRLNSRSRSRLANGFQTARSAYASRGLTPAGRSRSVGSAPLQVGDLVQLNVGSSACDSIVSRTARVVAIGTRSIVLSDTLNPSGGFATVDYQRFAARFDTLVYPLDVANFGEPADIDQNSKIELLFTTAVNELTPRNSTSYVGGFFFDRDLFPISATPDFQGCKGSNVGEIFYLLAPDPTGLVNGNIRRTGFVDSVTTSILAHEFQHLINASRRLYVSKGAENFEVTWLNEGLSHIAEELLFFHEARISPRRNVDSTLLRSDARIRSAYNADMSSNVSRYRLFLAAPSENSPLRSDDSLATRGATWNFLRYAADRKAGSGGSDVPTWQALANSTSTGVTNLRNVFGANIGGLLRDWSISQYTDDLVTGAASEYTQPSWNFHSVFPALTGAGNTYPLRTSALVGGSASGTLIGGGSAFYRFAIPANATASISVTGATVIQATVVRVR
ncbi:MAG: hypothetical protein ABIP93_15370 [Gemmatimonadaceae bacterium]